ncbi:Helix-turn-helix domain-containing protein [Algibacter lectus]|uniref:AraC family transcriptional regulator n=1 Tax=Algibacter lectus TaxID=221126 RepID=UPI0008EB13CE|nr:helix-turn-helix transcriptional regulator [Algibacter lectus]SFD73109.1 Helix-turn-helix domain-containing protein [Algibacter lectus]
MRTTKHNIDSDIFDFTTYLNPNSHPEYIEIKGLEINILIIEDDLRINQNYDEILSPNFDFVFSFNSLQALERTNQNQFNLILSNAIKPIVNGEVLKKEIPHFSNEINNDDIVPVLIITTKDIKDENLEGLNINDYVINLSDQKKIISKIKLYTNNADSSIKVTKKKSNTFHAILDLIKINLSKEDFNVNFLSYKTGYSQRQLARIVKAETNKTPVKLILELRLKKAYELLSTDKNIKIKEVQYSIGINSPSYFSKKFKEQFGYSPSDFSSAC